MNRNNIINYLINKFNYKSYLEIGYDVGSNFHKINLPISCKIAIDIKVPINDSCPINISSNNFFQSTYNKFDIIFIDGSHLCEDVYNDVENSLLHLNKNGTIVIHDCNPPNENYQQRTYIDGEGWCGDVWKAFVTLRVKRSDLEMYVINTDHGCGIVKFGKQQLLTINIPKDLTYINFINNKQQWLNLISTTTFKDKILNV